MNHVAIDLGGSKSQVCIRAEDGTILREQLVKTRELPGFLKTLPTSVVVMETCSESYAIAEAAKVAGHQVRVVAATLVQQLGVGHRGVKTDRRDAQALSAASCRIELPAVHIRSAIARDRLSRIKMRDALVTARTQLINCVRGWLRGRLVRVGGATEHFPANVRLALEDEAEGLPSYVDGLLAAITGLTEQIAVATEELSNIAAADPICTRLMSITGVGPITSLTFAAVVDDVSRFNEASGLESYIGLTPGERSSSSKVRRTGITKAGAAIMRQYLTQAALNLWRSRPDDPISEWADRIKQRRGKQVATIAVARKLAGIMFAIWRDASFYQPHRGALRRAQEATV
jgi:transposase